MGRLPEADDLLSSIYGWFTEGCGTSDLKDAKLLLELLGRQRLELAIPRCPDQARCTVHGKSTTNRSTLGFSGFAANGGIVAMATDCHGRYKR